MTADEKNLKGVCGHCLDGLKVGLNYEITCRIDNSVHHQWDTCSKFREEK